MTPTTPEFAAWRRAVVGAVLALVCLVSSAAGADDRAEVFTVAPVPVDVTAGSAASARAQAMAAGQQAAFEKLADRIVPATDRDAVPDLSPAEVQNFVLAIEVIRERTSDVRYVADLRVVFNRTAVRNLLLQYGVRFAETRSRPALLIPVLRMDGRDLLWEDGNLWRDVWQSSQAVQGLVPLVLPYGDLADIQDLDIEQALAPDIDRLLTMAGRYGARDAIVTVASLRGESGPLDVAIARHGEAGTVALPPVTVFAASEPGVEALLDAGVDQVNARIMESWKQANLVSPGVETRVSVVVPITDLGQWMDVRGRLDTIAILARREITQFGRSEARMDLWINGDEAQLRTALAQRDLELLDRGGGMLLKRTTDPLPDRYLQAPGENGSAPPPGAVSPGSSGTGASGTGSSGTGAGAPPLRFN